MTNHLQLPQDTLAFLAMIKASQEERDAALAKLVVISKDDLYRILSRRISEQDIDETWQEIKQAGTVLSQVLRQLAIPTRDGAASAVQTCIAEATGLACAGGSAKDVVDVLRTWFSAAPPKPAPSLMQDELERIEAMQVRHTATIAREVLELVKAASAPAPSPDGAKRYVWMCPFIGGNAWIECQESDSGARRFYEVRSPSPVVAAEPNPKS